jgi:hypothetical protein
MTSRDTYYRNAPQGVRSQSPTELRQLKAATTAGTKLMEMGAIVRLMPAGTNLPVHGPETAEKAT